LYGFGKSCLDNLITREGNFITELYVDNIEKFRKIVPSANSMALTGSKDFIEHRLRKRNECQSSMTQRLNVANEELRKIMESRSLFNFIYDVGFSNEHRVIQDITDYVGKEIQACMH